ncbi:MAG: universal stress protein [Bryobacteraceae bacterium]
MARILVPVDFSEPSRGVLRHAAALARHYDAKLTLLHVDELPGLLSRARRFGLKNANWESSLAEQAAGRRAELETFGAAELEGMAVQRLTRTGDPAHEIVNLARDEKTDLILMPTHGYGPIRRLLLGSVTAKVLHDADCPVWTESHGSETSESSSAKPRRVICGVRLDTESEKALSWAAEFAVESGATLVVAHSIPMPTPEAIYLASWYESARRSAEERIRNLTSGISGLPVTPTVVILDGYAPEALAVSARDLAAELLVIGRNCSSGLLGRLNSEAYEIIRSAPCAVVSV